MIATDPGPEELPRRRSFKVHLSTDAVGERQWIGATLVWVWECLFNEVDTEYQASGVSGGLQAVSALVAAMMTVALGLVLYARQEPRGPRPIIWLLYLGLSLPPMLGLYMMIISRTLDREGKRHFGLGQTERRLAIAQFLCWPILMACFSTAYAQGVFSPGVYLYPTKLVADGYKFTKLIDKYGIKPGDFGTRVVATLDTRGLDELPPETVIDIELAARYRDEWQIVAVDDPDAREEVPTLLGEWGTTSKKKAVWELQLDREYHLRVSLHKFKVRAGEKPKALPSDCLHIRANVQK